MSKQQRTKRERGRLVHRLIELDQLQAAALRPYVDGTESKTVSNTQRIIQAAASGRIAGRADEISRLALASYARSLLAEWSLQEAGIWRASLPRSRRAGLVDFYRRVGCWPTPADVSHAISLPYDAAIRMVFQADLQRLLEVQAQRDPRFTPVLDRWHEQLYAAASSPTTTKSRS